MSKFKAIMPCARMTSTGGSLGVSVEVQEDVDGKTVFREKASFDAYPQNTELEPYTLENQLRSGAQLKEVTVETLSTDVDRLNDVVSKLASRVDDFEKKEDVELITE